MATTFEDFKQEIIQKISKIKKSESYHSMKIGRAHV